MDYTFRRSGWHWAAKEFADGLKDASSYPLCYLFGVWLTLSGHMLGRRVWMRFPRQMFPNWYMLLVGPSAQGRKSTAMALGYDAIAELMEFTPPIRTVTTQQGLLQMMSEQGGHVLVWLDEFSSMAQKTKMDFGRDIHQRLTELYDCPISASNTTKQNPLTVYEPYLSILSASTSEWIQQTVSMSDMLGGLGNRLTFVLGDERPTLAWPGQPNHTLDWTMLALPEGELYPTDACKDMWVDWYTKFDERQRSSSPVLRTLAQRVPEKVWKTALIMSAWNNEPYITDATLEMAVDWGEYMYESIVKLIPAFEDKEKQVFTAIAEGYDTKRQLYKLLNHKMSPGQIQGAIKQLTWMGAVSTDGDFYACLVDELDKLEEVT
ncbi:hypothetical protein LCGC14_0423610 [marine sediment metagenome]|uniref:DUF3987 domain-containing protein n=1 Tax=marine sediment metagenome TaxID=412755 RepID=A0A0F9VZG3_9ZZZZ